MAPPSFLAFTVLVTMVVLMTSPASANSPLSSKPVSFTIFQQATPENTRLITTSSAGDLLVAAEFTTTGVSAKSTKVGTTYGTISQLTGGVGSDHVFLVFDFHIDGEVVINGKKVFLNGSFVAIGGSLITTGKTTTAILGGTGDFFGAKGTVTQSVVAGKLEGATATYRKDITVWL